MSETVLEVIIRLPDAASAEYVIGEIKRLLGEHTGARLENYGIFPAAIFDAPELPLEIEGVPA